MEITENLSLNFTGIGSLPFKNKNAPKEAMDYVFECCPEIPYWAQLPHFKKEEDMVFQFTQNLCGFEFDGKEGHFFLNDNSPEFFEGLEELFLDYETVIAGETLTENEEILDKYKISAPNSSTIEIFIEKIKTLNPKFTKGSITGPFTFSTSFPDSTGKLCYYNETLREVLTKFLSLKALWQVKEFKKSAPNAIPIIFMDEPSISQVGSCAFVTVKRESVVEMLKTISDNIKAFGAISGVHCCGKTDWEIAIESGVNIINFDAFCFSDSIGTYAKRLETYMKEGGILSFGIVPTMDVESLKNLEIEDLKEKFKHSLSCFTSKNVDKELILKHSFFTPSCGCGSLNVEMAKKALRLTGEIARYVKNGGSL